MKLNDIVQGFKVVQEKEIKDIGSKMYVLNHIQSGCELVYIENDDTNKCFAAGFRTLPEDSTGVCHIIEHSLLCGSKKYPTKEPFVNLLKGSMATFLNAMTAFDWTMYPVASQNDKDFSNLMSVYLDAVFAPLSVEDPKPFLQEGWHLEMNSVDEVPQYKGVVYNEMKGAMSSVDEQLQEKTLNAIYQGTCYEHNSGGEPDDIPNLTYDYYKNFYHKHYHPENCMMYLYGKMDVEEKLKYINDEYLSKYESTGNKIETKVAAAIINRDVEAFYEISADEELEDNTYMSLGFALDTYDNALDMTGMGILNEALMESNDSPLKKALLDLELGQDIMSSIDDDNILPTYHVYLQKTNPDKKEAFYNGFMDAVKKLVTEGIDKKLLLAVINSNEFKNKEMDSGRMPKGLFFAFSLMQSFNYHVPYENYLEYTKYFEYFKKELNNGYFEGLLEKYILNSKHYVQVVLLPSKTLGEEKAKAMQEKMQSIYDNMTEEEKLACVKQTEELVAYQSKKDTPEELASLPKLALTDINEDVNTLPTVEVKDGKYTFVEHEFNTNKIAYLKYFFDLETLTIDELPYALILSNLLGDLDTEELSVQDLLSYEKTYLGRLNFSLLIGGKDKDSCVTKFGVAASSLEENINKIPYLLNQVLNHTIYDEAKINTVLLQMQNSYRSSIIENGMNIVRSICRYGNSKEGTATETIGSYNMYQVLKELTANYDGAFLSKKLQALANKIFNVNNVIVSVSGDESTIAQLKDAVKEVELNEELLETKLDLCATPFASKAVVIPSGVSYNGKALNLKDLDSSYQGSIRVLAHMLNYDYLWPEVRVKGGAYGCGLAVYPNGDLAFGSYRDPNVENTFNAYDNVCEYLENLAINQEEFEGYLIGAIGSFDQPASNSAQISTADSNYIMGVTDDSRRALKRQMIQTSLEDIKSYAKLFRKFAQEATNFTIGNEAKIKEYNQFDTIETL